MSAAEIEHLTEPRIKTPSGPPPERLEVSDIRRGWGRVAAAADEVTIEFAGVGYRRGEGRWRSRDALGPFRFQLGGYGVIAGWERGIAGMKVGGRRELRVPARLATGQGARIYVIDLLAVHRQTGSSTALGASDGPQDPGKPTVALPRPPPKEIVVTEVRKGSGKPVEIPGHATVKYVGVDYRTDYSFFNAWGPNLPSRLLLEDAHSVWARGLAGMRVGGRRQIFVPAKLAYGGGPLVFVLELTAVG